MSLSRMRPIGLAVAVAAVSVAAAACGGGGRASPAQSAAIRSTAAAFTRNLTATHIADACDLLTASSASALGAAEGEGCVQVLKRVVAVSTPAQLKAIGQRAADLARAPITVSGDRASWRGRLGALYSHGHWRLIAAPAGQGAIVNAAALERWLSASAREFIYGAPPSRF